MKTLMGLKRHDCRFVLPDRVDGLHAFCCKPIARGSYCAEHYDVVWTPARRDWSTEKQAKAADHFAGGKLREPVEREQAPPTVDVFINGRLAEMNALRPGSQSRRAKVRK